ncbi:hypothetical protein, partial [Actinoplanes philippinensis]|uniref:hypothetical protein n=1 Tax=Actinoplanes philippinensis TaxID=35752 RepID=UPI003403E17A
MRRGLWVYAVVVIAVAVALAPVGGHRMGVHPNLVIVFLVLMPTADLLTGYLLAQQFLARGRLTTLSLSGVYLFSSLVMTAYAIAFTRSQASGMSPIWSEVCAPLLGWVVVAGFPVLVAAIPSRRHD